MFSFNTWFPLFLLLLQPNTWLCGQLATRWGSTKCPTLSLKSKSITITKQILFLLLMSHWEQWSKLRSGSTCGKHKKQSHDLTGALVPLTREFILAWPIHTRWQRYGCFCGLPGPQLTNMHPHALISRLFLLFSFKNKMKWGWKAGRTEAWKRHYTKKTTTVVGSANPWDTLSEAGRIVWRSITSHLSCSYALPQASAVGHCPSAEWTVWLFL